MSWRAALARLVAQRAARLSLAALAALAALALAAPLLPLPSPMAIDLQLEPEPPRPPWVELGRGGWERGEYWELGPVDGALRDLRARLFGDWQTGRWLGTDAKGRDVLARIVWGSRVSLQVALAAALASLVIGVAWGAVSGLAGGRVDELMMRAVDALYAIPLVFLVVCVLAFAHERREALSAAGIEPDHVLYLVVGAVTWLSMARVVRGQVLALRGADFVQAARALGASETRVLLAHVLPNVLPVVVVYLTLSVPSVILLESFLSFLGLGVQPPRVSWGLLAVDALEALNPVHASWWLVAFVSLAMGGTLLALNVLGDCLRDALDPRLSGERA